MNVVTIKNAITERDFGVYLGNVFYFGDDFINSVKMNNFDSVGKYFGADGYIDYGISNQSYFCDKNRIIDGLIKSIYLWPVPIPISFQGIPSDGYFLDDFVDFKDGVGDAFYEFGVMNFDFV